MKVWYDLKTGVPGIRLAVPSDEDVIFNLLLMLHGENGHFTLNHFKVIDTIRALIARNKGLLFVNEGPQIVATLSVILTQDWYSDDVYLMELWNFVHPDYRRTDYARKLIEQAKWSSEYFSHLHGKPLPLQVGILSLDRTESKVRLYSRHMPCIGAFFMYGRPPITAAAERVRTEVAEIQKMNSGGNKLKQARPVVETVIRMSKSATTGLVGLGEGNGKPEGQSFNHN